jgi:hypothetical protein
LLGASFDQNAVQQKVSDGRWLPFSIDASNALTQKGAYQRFSSLGAADCSQERYPCRAASHTPTQDSPED